MYGPINANGSACSMLPWPSRRECQLRSRRRTRQTGLKQILLLSLRVARRLYSIPSYGRTSLPTNAAALLRHCKPPVRIAVTMLQSAGFEWKRAIPETQRFAFAFGQGERIACWHVAASTARLCIGAVLRKQLLP